MTKRRLSQHLENDEGKNSGAVAEPRPKRRRGPGSVVCLVGPVAEQKLSTAISLPPSPDNLEKDRDQKRER